MLMSVNYNSAVLKLVDRLTDVMLIRAGTSGVDWNNLPSMSQKFEKDAADKKRIADAYYKALKAWEDGGRMGDEPVKPLSMVRQETDMRLAEGWAASRKPGYGGGPSYDR